MDLKEALIQCLRDKNGYCKDTLSKCCLAASSPRASEETRVCPFHSKEMKRLATSTESNIVLVGIQHEMLLYCNCSLALFLQL